MTANPHTPAGRRRLWWSSIATPAAAVIALLAVLVGYGLTTTSGPFRDWLDMRWQPGAWALRAGDFPRGTATTLDVQEAWMTAARETDPERWPALTRLPGLRHLTWDRYEPAPGLMRSGVRVGDLDVFTSVLVVRDEPDTTQGTTEVEYELQHALSDHEYAVLDDTGERPVPPGVTVDEPLFTDPALQDPVHLGDRTVTTRRADGGPSIEIEEHGPHGYLGVAGTTTDAVTGEPRQVAAVMALRGGYLVAIGLSAPTTADIDWEDEVDRLVGMIDAKMDADLGTER